MSSHLLVAHTADLDPRVLAASRGLLYAAFDDMTESDWEHALGGMHAVLHDGDDVLAHASLVQRRLLHAGRALRTGYVEGVAVHPEHRRLGHGATVMRALEQVVGGAYELGALAATDEAVPFYAALGWQSWTGPAAALTPAGVVPTPDVGGALFVLPVDVTLDPAQPLTCDWRDGDVW